MKFLELCNKFMFTRRLNIFDMATIILISNLITQYSWWYAVLYIPTILFSTFMEIKLGFNYGENHGATTMV